MLANCTELFRLPRLWIGVIVTGNEDGARIEMDLACGILDLKSQDAIDSAERAMQGCVPSTTLDTDSSDTSSGDTGDTVSETDAEGSEFDSEDTLHTEAMVSNSKEDDGLKQTGSVQHRRSEHLPKGSQATLKPTSWKIVELWFTIPAT